MQTLIVILIVGVALGWFVRRLYRSATTDTVSTCGGDCGSCGANKSPEEFS
jgi:FeoB-associated Cys-rich membrane protein